MPDINDMKPADAHKLDSLPEDLFGHHSLDRLLKLKTFEDSTINLCGYPLKGGDPVYRCRTCRFNNYALLCANCYHASQHENHDVELIFPELSGGFCDCGDAEAWKRDIHCTLHPLAQSPSSIPQEADFNFLTEALKKGLDQKDRKEYEKWSEIIGFTLDFIVYTFALHYFTQDDPVPITFERNVPQWKDLQDQYPGEENFTVLLWNDECPSFDEVIEQVELACSPSPDQQQGKRAAESVHDVGRAIIASSSDGPRLVDIASSISETRLGVTIRPTRDVYREIMAEKLLNWIAELAKKSFIVRRIICEQFMTPMNLDSFASLGEENDSDGLSVLPTWCNSKRTTIFARNFEKLRDYMSNNVLWKNKFERSKRCDSRRKREFARNFEKLQDSMVQNVFCKNRTKNPKLADFDNLLRLDMLLLSDLKLWKIIRLKLREIYVSTFLADHIFKYHFSTRFTLCHPKIIEGFLTKDHEPINNIAIFSRKIFTSPSLAEFVVKKFDLLKALYSMLQQHLLFNRVVPCNGVVQKMRPIGDHNTLFSCTSPQFDPSKFIPLFFDIKYLMKSDGVKSHIANDPQVAEAFVDLVHSFFGLDSYERHTSRHIEYESDSWSDAFYLLGELTDNITIFCEALSDSSSSLHALVYAYELMLSTIDNESISYKEVAVWNTYSALVIDYQVSEMPLSFHHGTVWIISRLLYAVYKRKAIKSTQELLDLIKPNSFEHSEGKVTRFLLPLLEYPLRTFSWLAQIRAGLWVRNGSAVHDQASSYKSIELRESTVDQDLWLVQLCASCLSPEVFLGNLIVKFELEAFIDYNGAAPMSTYQAIMMEELFQLILNILTYRTKISCIGTEKEIEMEIIQILNCGPQSFSEISEQISDRLADHESFEIILKTLATLEIPDKLDETGRYELKPEYFKRYYPFYFHDSRARWETAETYRSRKLSKDDRKMDFSAVPEIDDSSMFHELISLTNSEFFCCILASGISWNMGAFLEYNEQDRLIISDYLLSEVLHIIHFLLTRLQREADSKFLKNIAYVRHNFRIFDEDNKEESSIKDVSVLELLLQISNCDDYSNWKDQLESIFSLVKARNIAYSAIIDRYYKERESKIQESENQSLQKQKETEERRRKIFDKFNEQQSNFAKNHSSLYDEVESDLDEDDNLMNRAFSSENLALSEEEIFNRKKRKYKWNLFGGSCIYCQEVIERGSNFGLVGFVQSSTVLREWDDSVVTLEQILDQDEIYQFCPSESYPIGNFASTCGHLMHENCFGEFWSSLYAQSGSLSLSFCYRIDSKYLCPLCQSISNILLPVPNNFKMNFKESELGERVTIDKYEDWYQITLTEIRNLAMKYGLIMDLDNFREFTINAFSFTAKKRHVKEEDYCYLKKFVTNHVRKCEAVRSFQRIKKHKSVRSKYGLDNVTENLIVGVRYMASLDRFRIRSGCNDSLMENFFRWEPWTMLNYTLSCHENMLPLKESKNLSQNSINPLGLLAIRVITENLLRMDSKNDDDRDYIEDKNILIVEGIDILVRIFGADLGLELSMPLLLDDPSFILTKYLTCSYLLEHNIFGIVNRKFLVGKLLLQEISRAALASFGFGQEYPRTRINNQDLKKLHESSNLHSFILALIESNFEGARLAIKSLNDRQIHKWLVQMQAASKKKIHSLKYQELCKLLKTLSFRFLRRAHLLIHEALRYEYESYPNITNYDSLLNSFGFHSFDELFEISWLRSRESCVKESQRLGYFSADSWRSYAENIIEFDPALKAMIKEIPVDSICVAYPFEYQLYPLVEDLQALTEDFVLRKCKKRGFIAHDPAICLVCGELICWPTASPTEKMVQECQLHKAECGLEIGLFFLVKQNATLMLHMQNRSCIVNSPYLSAHGEAGVGSHFLRSKSLIKSRYDELRGIYLRHQIPAIINRETQPTNNDVIHWVNF